MTMQPIQLLQETRNAPQSCLSKVPQELNKAFALLLKKSGILFDSKPPSTNPAELPVKILKALEPVKTTVNERIELECEVSEEGAQVKW